MKKLLLIAMALIIGVVAYSQNKVQLSKEMREQTVTLTRQNDIAEEIVFGNFSDPTVSNSKAAPIETLIGTTKYDLMTNSMIQNRLYLHGDNTIGAVWTMGLGTEPAFSDRGTGYNYYDGAQWGDPPTVRIEPERTGWPAYAPWGPNGEIIAAHTGSAGLIFSKRENKGTGDWTNSYLSPVSPISPTWPRIVTTGEQNEILHVIYDSYAAYNDQTYALLYARSSDGGETWDVLNQTFEDFGANYYSEIGGDAYGLAANGNTVAILISDTWTSDLAYVKSTDGGETWDKTVIWEHPYPFYDWDVTVTDTFFAPDGSATIAVDNNGKVHVSFGICRVLHDVVGTNYTLWPGCWAVGYWNEDMEPFSLGNNTLAPAEWEKEGSELIDEYNRIGYVLETDPADLKDEYMYYRTIGLVNMPAITVDDLGRVFVVYSAIADGYMNATYNYRHIWARGYENGIWGDFVDLNTDIFHIFDECIWPVVSPTSDDYIHIMYMADQTPGTALDSDHSYVVNNMYYAALPKEDLLTGVKDVEPVNIESVSQNFPNPFNGMTTVAVKLTSKANLSLTVTNMLGQEVLSIEKGEVPEGVQYFEIDAANLTNGVYFYTVRAGEATMTRKMIVRK